MTSYLLRRVGQAILVLVVVSVVTFLLTRLLPGDSAKAILGERASNLQLRTFRHEHGYDRSVFVQYWDYLVRLVHGDLGFSYRQNQSVVGLIKQNVPPTALLMGASILVAVVIAVPVGLLQAAYQKRPFDHLATGAAFVFYSMPSFWLGILLVYVFAVKLQVFPAGAPGGDLGAILRNPMGLVLPIATLALITVAEFTRYMRSSALDNLAEGYAGTARAKGASEPRIWFRHILRNAAIPIITLLGMRLPNLFGGALITEGVFNYPGMGLLFWNATQSHDYPVLLALTLIASVATVVGSLLADILYAVLDPRVRYTKVG